MVKQRTSDFLSESGSIAVLLALLVCMVVTTGLGILGLMRQWRIHAQTQLRLNRCVGQTALELRDHLSQIESSNLKIEALRLAIVAASVQPELLPALRAALDAVVQYQDLRLGRWKLKQGAWLVMGGCVGTRDDPTPLPTLKFERPMADVVGPQKLEWVSDAIGGGNGSALVVQLRHAPRLSVAVVFRKDLQGVWSAAWGLRGLGIMADSLP